MIRVICIDGKPTHPTVKYLPDFVELSAKQCDIFEDCYDISGYEYDNEGTPICWGKRRFIPLSDIDEVQEVEKLLRYLESDFYETYLNKKK